MRTVYVTLYTWEWEPIGQVTIDIACIERNGEIDRAELDDMVQRASRPLLEEKDVRDIHVFVHEGDPATPEELREAAKKQHVKKGPNSISWGRSRRIKNPGPIDPKPFEIEGFR